MNFIKRLQQENKDQAEAIKEIRKRILDFHAHLRSEKFHSDPTIQVADVHRWLDVIGQPTII